MTFEEWWEKVNHKLWESDTHELITMISCRRTWQASRKQALMEAAEVAEGKEFGNCSAVEGRVRHIIAAKLREMGKE